MNLRTWFLGLLGLTAGVHSPALQDDAADEDARRTSWVEQTRNLDADTAVTEVEAWVGKHRQPCRPRAGIRRQWSDTRRHHTLYQLDRDFDLHVVRQDHDAESILSAEVVGFPDLRRRIEPDLYRHVKAIHDSPNVCAIDFDPVMLVAAVNSLHSLGKDKALRALRAYHDLVVEREPRRSPKYELDEVKIFLIVRLLFVRSDAAPDMPPLVLGAPDVNDPGTKSWPLFPLAVEGDLPFIVVNGYTLFGEAESPLEHLEFASSKCKLRDRPLSPSTTPVEAVNRLTSSACWKELGLDPREETAKRRQMRNQALRALSAVTAFRSRELRGPGGRDRKADPEIEWREAEESIRALNPRWDARAQEFVQGR